MIVPPMNSSKITGKNFTSNEILYLSRIRIIKKNLVHAHGFPSNLANTDKLSQFEYFGQYGIIKKTLISLKTNSETNKTTFSVYITYSNEIEASFAILAVDSLLIEGKLIRAFFGTTKYCNYFLNNSQCPNEEKCIFLHKLVEDKDIIIDPDSIFSYNEHINLAKKIIHFSNPEKTKMILNSHRPRNTIFPNIDYIFLNEDQKENYIKSKGFSYIKSDINKNQSNIINNYYYNNINIIDANLQNNLINGNNFYFNQNINFINNNVGKNNSIGSLTINKYNNNNKISSINTLSNNEKSYKNINLNEPLSMYEMFKKPIKHILSAKPLFTKINDNKLINIIEFNYLKKELKNKGINIYNILNGCLDNIKDIDDDN